MNSFELKKLIREELEHILNEQLSIQDMHKLKKMSNEFASTLIREGVVKSQHKDLTSSDVSANEYTEDLGEIIRNAVQRWMGTVNKRAGR